MKKLILSLLASLALAVNTGCGKLIDDYIISLSKSNVDTSTLNIPIRYVDELVVNNSLEYRTAIQQDEEEGIKEMKKLVEDSDLEEIWVYLPKKTQWIEIGKKSYPEQRLESGVYITKAEIDGVFLKKIMEENNEISVHQFHPAGSKMLDDIVRECKEKGEPMSREQISELESTISVIEAVPSDYDLVNLILNSQDFFTLHPEGKIIYKLCSLYGVTEFYLTEEGKNLYKDKNALQILMMKTVSRTAVDVNFSNIKSSDENEKIQKLCNLVGHGSTQIKFSPYTNS